MQYALLVTGPAYGTQQATSAYLFTQALLSAGHRLESVFFYCEGVLNANRLIAPASDDFDLVRAWQKLHDEKDIVLNICVSAALRRGVTDAQEAARLQLSGSNLQPGFVFTGLCALAEVVLRCERMVQF